MKKRSFLKKLSSISLLGFIPNKIFNNPLEESDVQKSSSEDEFWKRIRSHYDLNDEFINLESGYYNIVPIPTICLLYTSPSPRDRQKSRMPSSA